MNSPKTENQTERRGARDPWDRERIICPRCGRVLRYRYDGLFRWRACRATKQCGWTVFTHGDDPRDKQ